MSLHVLGERFLTIGDQRVRYVVSGHGDPILLLHGLPACVLDWRALRAPLARLGRVIAVDLAGFGLTDPSPDGDVSAPGLARFTARFLDALGEERPALLVGHSNGGAVAQVLAAEEPARVRGLVLVGSIGFPLPVASIPLLRSATVRQTILGAYHALPRPLLRALLRQILERNYVEQNYMEEHFRWAEALIRDPGALERVLRCAASMNADLHKRIAPQIPVPTLIVHGENDRMVPPAVAENLRRAIPRARLVLVRGGSHMIHVEQAPAVAALVEEFAGTLAAMRRAAPAGGG